MEIFPSLPTHLPIRHRPDERVGYKGAALSLAVHMSASEDGVGDGPCSRRVGSSGPIEELQGLQLKGGAAAEDTYCPLALWGEGRGDYKGLSGDGGGKYGILRAKMPISLLTSRAQCRGIRLSAHSPSIHTR